MGYILPTIQEFKEGEEEEEEEGEEGEERDLKKEGKEKEKPDFNKNELIGLNLGALKRRIRLAQLELKKTQREKSAHEQAHISHGSRIRILQVRNQELEGAIDSFSKEIGDLQKLA